MKQLDIEIFPEEKTCEQGCSTCPLARKEQEINFSTIHPQVQQTFTLLEELLGKRRARYDLHFTAAGESMFPLLRYPRLIRMARFETIKDAHSLSVSSCIRELLALRGIRPKVIGVSVVPKHPILDEHDADKVRLLMHEISAWHSCHESRSIEVTMRSNLLPDSLFSTLLPLLSEADHQQISPIMKNFSGSYDEKLIGNGYVFPGGRLYCKEYKAQTKRGSFTVTNRVIGSQKIEKEKLPGLHREQILALWRVARFLPSIGISPKGVMLMHSSLAVNNPCIWVSHSDFRTQILMLYRKGMPLNVFVQRMLMQNSAMYHFFAENKKEDVVLRNDDFLNIFEEWRSRCA